MKTDTTENPLCECDNCGYRAHYNSLPPAKDIEERCADPRDEYSDVECPKCGALCFEVPPSDQTALVRELVRALENALAYVPMAASGSSLETHPVRIEAKRVIAKAQKLS